MSQKITAVRLVALISQTTKKGSTDSKWGNWQQTDSGTEPTSPDHIGLCKKSSVQPLISKATQLWKTSSVCPSWPPSPGLRRLSYPSNSLSRMRVKMVMLSLLSSTTSETCFWESLVCKRGKKEIKTSSEEKPTLSTLWAVTGNEGMSAHAPACAAVVHACS